MIISQDVFILEKFDLYVYKTIIYFETFIFLCYQILKVEEDKYLK